MNRLSIEVYFDLICPWCLIGKANLAKARESLSRLHPEVSVEELWRSFPLLPDTPLSGLPFQAFYLQRLGSPAAVAARRAVVREAGRTAGVEFAFERIEVLPSTFLAHNLISRASDPAALIARLFDAYFTDGRDIGSPEVLADIAPDLVAAAPSLDQTETWRKAGLRHGVTGVPAYVINGGTTLSGALAPETLLKNMLAALES